MTTRATSAPGPTEGPPLTMTTVRRTCRPLRPLRLPEGGRPAGFPPFPVFRRSSTTSVRCPAVRKHPAPAASPFPYPLSCPSSATLAMRTSVPWMSSSPFVVPPYPADTSGLLACRAPASGDAAVRDAGGFSVCVVKTDTTFISPCQGSSPSIGVNGRAFRCASTSVTACAPSERDAPAGPDSLTLRATITDFPRLRR